MPATQTSRTVAPPLPSLLRLEQHHLDQSTQIGLASMFRTLGVDDRVPGFKDIAEMVGDLLNDPVLLPTALNRRWRNWRRLNQRLLAAGDRLKSWADPTRGKVERYPFIACLLQPSAIPQAGQIRALKQLLIAGLMLREGGAPIGKAVTAAAPQVRLACAETSERTRRVLELMPGPFSLSYVIGLNRTTADLLTKVEPDSPSGRMLRAIQTLADLVLRWADYTGQRQRLPTVEVADPLQQLGELGAVNVAGDQDDESGDEPDQVVQLREPAQEPGAELSNKGWLAAGLQSRSWLIQTEAGVLWSRSRISPTEWPRVQRLLQSLPQLAASGKLEAPYATVIALVTALGRTVEDVLTTKVGRNLELDWRGSYRRKIPVPENAFRPAVDEQPFYAPAPVHEIVFELPHTVKSLLAAVKVPEHSGEQTVSTALGLKIATTEDRQNTLRSIRETLGELLRAHVDPRLQYRHLQAALRQLVYDRTQDPLVTYLIAGRPNEAAGSGLYYARIPVQRLLEIHKAIMDFMFGSG